ncbi:MAG: YkgJ family cysteine cluster protein [Desulfobulbaceae bacterium]|nr:YkgJ family cysteine cluster protein [Pseudomonadota bacterium]MCG2747570.1 YkgJ family cysteine cluster protein [Desulfobulbaceae bacterium]
MLVTTKLTCTDNLPLTCSRSGTCCHGKMVRLNPWELACLAEAKELTPRAFRDRYCDFGGIHLRFDGAPGWKQQPACSQYVPDFGCSVHLGRPLACRLYPLGRQRQGEELYYMYQGSEFPCMEGCPEVLDLPQLSVAAYIEGQATKRFEVAQDEYLDLMQNIADIAFAFLLESGLAESGDRQTLRLWREMGREEPEQLAERLGSEWIDLLMLPELMDGLNDPVAFSRQHYDLLLSKAQESFGTLDNVTDFCEASELMMGLALHLGRGLGANPAGLAEHWIKTAKEHGALD